MPGWPINWLLLSSHRCTTAIEVEPSCRHYRVTQCGGWIVVSGRDCVCYFLDKLEKTTTFSLWLSGASPKARWGWPKLSLLACVSRESHSILMCAALVGCRGEAHFILLLSVSLFSFLFLFASSCVFPSSRIQRENWVYNIIFVLLFSVSILTSSKMDTLSSHMEVKLDIREKRSDWLPLRVSWILFCCWWNSEWSCEKNTSEISEINLQTIFFFISLNIHAIRHGHGAMWKLKRSNAFPATWKSHFISDKAMRRRAKDSCSASTFQA